MPLIAQPAGPLVPHGAAQRVLSQGLTGDVPGANRNRMTIGLTIRAQIDSEQVKGLLLVNGGAAVALLAFLPTIFGKPNLDPLVDGRVFQVGIVMAVAHNRLRRVCSLVYENYKNQPPPCRFIPAWMKRNDPCVCAVSIVAMWLSLACFLAGGMLVLAGGLSVEPHLDPDQIACWQLQTLDGNAYKVNQCTGSFERVDIYNQ